MSRLVRIRNWLQKFRADDHGTTAVEYAVMLALILLVVITGVTNFGLAQKGMWEKTDTQMKAHGVN